MLMLILAARPSIEASDGQERVELAQDARFLCKRLVTTALYYGGS
jgi:hypothetical protein